MAKRLWKPEERANAQALITFLLGKRQPGGGWPVEAVTSIAIDELAASIETSVPTHKRVLSVLAAMKESGHGSVDDFEREAPKVARKIEQTNAGRTQTWSFLLPMVATLAKAAGERVSFTVGGAELEVMSRAAAQRSLRSRLKLQPADIGRAVHAQVEVVPDVFVRVKGRGTDLHSAWAAAQSTFSLFRGVFEFATGFGSWSIQSGQRRSRATIPHPPWMVGVPQTGSVDGTFFLLDHSKTDRNERFEFNVQRIGVLRRQLRRLAQTPLGDSTLSIIGDALRLYADAMDTQFPHGCLLGLWQTAEVLTLSKEFGGRTEEVCRRLEWHGPRLGFVGSGFRHILKHTAEKRNLLVHHGIHEVDDNDVNNFKTVIDSALHWLIRSRSRIRTRDRLARFLLRGVGTSPGRPVDYRRSTARPPGAAPVTSRAAKSRTQRSVSLSICSECVVIVGECDHVNAIRSVRVSAAGDAEPVEEPTPGREPEAPDGVCRRRAQHAVAGLGRDELGHLGRNCRKLVAVAHRGSQGLRRGSVLLSVGHVHLTFRIAG